MGCEGHVQITKGLKEDCFEAAQALLSDEKTVAVKMASGNDLIIYTLAMSEFVTDSKSPEPSPSTVPTVGSDVPGNGGGSGGIYTGAINQGTQQPKEIFSFTDITRAEFATLIVKMLKLTGNFQEIFEDVEQGAWYASFVNLAAQAGLISGMGDGTFAPNANATRAQAVSILKRLLDK